MPDKGYKRSNVVLLGILLLALILRIIYLDSKSLWLDEATNIYEAGKNILSRDMTLPPLYFTFMHFWLAIGNSELTVRFPSVVLGVLSVLIIYEIGLILYSEKEALISAFLLSISQTAIYFSQEARYYSLFIALSLLSVYFFLRMEERPTGFNKTLFLVFIALDFYSHYFTVLLLFVFVFFKIWKYKKDKTGMNEMRSFLILAGVFLLLIAPAVPVFLSEAAGRAGTSYIRFASQTYLSSDFIKSIFTYLIVNEFYAGESVLPYVLLGLFLYGIFSSLKHYEKSAVFLVMWLFIPIASALVLTGIISNLHIRYLVFVLPALLLISSRGIAAFPEGINSLAGKIRVRRVDLNPYAVILLLMVLIVSLSYPILGSYYGFKNYDWRGAAEFLDENAEDGSKIVVVPGYNSFPFNYYYKPRNGITVLEYSSVDDLEQLSRQNDTYLVSTEDVFSLAPREVSKLSTWVSTNMELETELSLVKIFKNTAVRK